MPIEPSVAVVVVAVGFVAWLLFIHYRHPPVAPPPVVTLEHIESVFRALHGARGDGNFAVLLFGENGEPPKHADALNVQFSVEGGRMGLDWVLLAPDNVAARRQVAAFLEHRGYQVEEREMNGVRYLRVEGDGLVDTCRALLSDVFAVQAGQELQLIPEGFPWPA